MTGGNSYPYNTALKSPRFDYAGRDKLDRLQYVNTNRGMVFAHDMCKPLPEVRMNVIRERCQCVYTEIPWMAGWGIFHERAGKSPSNGYGFFVDAIKRLIDELQKPSFVVCSKAIVNRLNPPEVLPIRLHTTHACLGLWNSPHMEGVETVPALLNRLGQDYESAYDPCCGYGNGLRPFKYFVGSDIDEKCLAYVNAKILINESSR